MGLIRFLLAWSVVIFHSKSVFGLEMVHGGLAVEAFFVISGFYMALVLTEKYPSSVRGSYTTFIVSRFTRLFPAYWICLFVGIAANLLTYHFAGKAVYTIKLWEQLVQQGSWSQIVPLALSNLTLFGQEIYQTLFFSPDFLQNQWPPSPSGDWISGKSLLMLPQAWSISVEFQFYLLAPFLLRARTRTIALILAGSFLFRGWLVHTKGWDAGGTLAYYLFLPQLALFLLGSLSYRVYSYFKSSEGFCVKGWGWMARILLVASIVLFQWIPGTLFFKEWLLAGMTSLAIPFIFALTKNIKWDRELGELSYPIYISHVTIVQFSDRWADKSGWSERGVLLSVLVFIAAWLLYRWVDTPLDRWRQKWVQSRTGKQH